MSFFRRVDYESCSDARIFLLRDRPRFAQALACSIRGGLYGSRIESISCDGQSTAHRLEENEESLSARGGVGMLKLRRSLNEYIVFFCQILHLNILNLA